MRRLAAALVCASLALAAPTVVLATAKRSWAEAEIKLATAHGLMGGDPAAFRPDAPLTRAALDELVFGLTGRPQQPTGVSNAHVSIAALDRALVRALGLGDDARLFDLGLRAAGLRSPSRFGSEVVARLLGLRKNHEVPNDHLELLPGDDATRAEAAYSAAQVLRLGKWQTASVEDASAEFELPPYTAWQRRVLQTAVNLIGYPYVWGGMSPAPQTLQGVASLGGFDCSGFVWRVFKLHRYSHGGALAQTLRGRTAAQMAAEVPGARRISLEQLEPGDVMFFGRGGRRARAAAIDHAGVYLGGNWMIHSSRYGVALAPVAGWYAERFAWGRRPLAEAGLA
ncbi:MAG TPA: NlpC/P60 family protein [Gaiellaceae bacterium]|nr:NlpC/P60 family protein [Gaiellaceae bacterium]